MKLTRIAALAASSMLIGLAPGLSAAGEGTLKVALNDSAAAVQPSERPLAVMLDQPSGGIFSYFPEQGWKFTGRNGTVEMPAVVSGYAAGQPLSLFVDGPTGFVYSYLANKGWQFVGQVDQSGR